ncbi:hypothetical protein GJA_2231 [Janthinobacterium agaricidamnosum NBRC 102515 = DSM 9628]|uniref:Uncharacterized protein n=1 Tax=Janthinobacterium agaricidamnosum NBRC 102515 = DSM 9628 TaxID=1349767 RepID=W0V4R6_9BURK|nr:hypothetical protein GJA_2231 [Janthinobacterium agaricidamnosum NBRC 102515 = DSM 9628]
MKSRNHADSGVPRRRLLLQVSGSQLYFCQSNDTIKVGSCAV